jgi:hypothetical protein
VYFLATRTNERDKNGEKTFTHTFSASNGRKVKEKG